MPRSCRQPSVSPESLATLIICDMVQRHSSHLVYEFASQQEANDVLAVLKKKIPELVVNNDANLT